MSNVTDIVINFELVYSKFKRIKKEKFSYRMLVPYITRKKLLCDSTHQISFRDITTRGSYNNELLKCNELS